MSETTISTETAKTALEELENLIERTGGGDSEVPECCSVLALALDRVKKSNELTGEAEAAAVKIIEEVGDERNVPTDWYDPLADSVFDARTELREVIHTFEEGDVYMTPDGPIRILAIKDDGTAEVTDPTVGHPLDSRSDRVTDPTVGNPREGRSGVWYPDLDSIERGIQNGCLQPASLKVQIEE